MDNAIDLFENWVDSTSFFMTGYDPGFGSDSALNSVDTTINNAESSIASSASSAASSIASNVLPSKTTLAVGSIILIVILVLVLMILGKAEGIGLGL